MTILQTKEDLQQYLGPYKQANKCIGFVPTMGALHQGHLSLASRALEECALVVVSIFVNPTQFNNPEDLEKYPRQLAQDVAILSALNTDIVVFSPTSENIYAGQVKARQYDFGDLGSFMEGLHRPGHFDGVASVVALLFDAVTPDRAYFGEKDYQQLRIVESLVALEKRPVIIVPCAIARSAEGLALSSRNQRLNALQRQQALILIQVLRDARKNFDTTSIEAIKKQVFTAFENNPECTLEYFEIADVVSLVPRNTKDPKKKYRAFIAAHIAGVRLIDNIELN